MIRNLIYVVLLGVETGAAGYYLALGDGFTCLWLLACAVPFALLLVLETN